MIRKHFVVSVQALAALALVFADADVSIGVVKANLREVVR
ncbi:hypothetical protein FHR87_000017 [Azomonas macrocytogenes]|uniref:Uncharacterized protein n=1 Tax=Azomonas macrocytogenes TaxID=69962 RepID=A0A839SW79_AZOMA|nr:hypothetical protein [Azomonas macrocytogenes]